MVLTCFLKGVMFPFPIPNKWDPLVHACLLPFHFLPLAQGNLPAAIKGTRRKKRKKKSFFFDDETSGPQPKAFPFAGSPTRFISFVAAIP